MVVSSAVFARSCATQLLNAALRLGRFPTKKSKPHQPYHIHIIVCIFCALDRTPRLAALQRRIQSRICFFYTPQRPNTCHLLHLFFFSEFWIGTGTGKMVMSNSVLVSYFGCHEQFVKATLSKHSVQKPQWSVVSFSVSPNKTLWFIHHFLGVKTIKRSNHIRYPHNSVWPGCARHRSYSK